MSSEIYYISSRYQLSVRSRWLHTLIIVNLGDFYVGDAHLNSPLFISSIFWHQVQPLNKFLFSVFFLIIKHSINFSTAINYFFTLLNPHKLSQIEMYLFFFFREMNFQTARNFSLTVNRNTRPYTWTATVAMSKQIECEQNKTTQRKCDSVSSRHRRMFETRIFTAENVSNHIFAKRKNERFDWKFWTLFAYL